VLGFELGIGVNVATSVTIAPSETFGGAASVKEKLLVMVIPAVACFDESATLCTVTMTFVDAGKICGAV
jgi:hypothetical protein